MSTQLHARNAVQETNLNATTQPFAKTAEGRINRMYIYFRFQARHERKMRSCLRFLFSYSNPSICVTKKRFPTPNPLNSCAEEKTNHNPGMGIHDSMPIHLPAKRKRLSELPVTGDERYLPGQQSTQLPEPKTAWELDGAGYHAYSNEDQDQAVGELGPRSSGRAGATSCL